jgi:transcriptional regulator with GAF, ATPase, and Fis domain/tetratricopeptide (TPR) repeat protein
MTLPSGRHRSQNGPVQSENDFSCLETAERLFRLGRPAEIGPYIEQLNRAALSPETVVRLAIVHGTALFELGDAIAAEEQLQRAVDLSVECSSELQFASALSLFSRQSQFLAPEEGLSPLSRLRQLATTVGDATALGNLHLVVARLEGCRGHCINARRHLQVASQLLSRSNRPTYTSIVELVDSGLEMYGGNLNRALQAARTGVEAAQTGGLSMPLAGSLTNLGYLAMLTGQTDRARDCLEQSLALCESFRMIRLSGLDSLCQLEIFEGKTNAARTLLDDCRAVIVDHRLPAPSWSDLAHQLTRCAYFESLGDWPAIVSTVDAVDAELARRQYKAVRTSLLCARARALARLERHAQAEQSLATAVRICPRGAVDPLIVLEASKALCGSLRGDVGQGAVHYDRALAACRAIGHRYHEWWIERDRQEVTRRRGAAPVARPPRDLTETALLLGDVATILGAGHSIDLLAHRMAAILQGTTMGARVEVTSESGRQHQPEPSAAWEAGADGTFRIRLRGSDRRVSIQVRDVSSIDEISLLKSVADLVQAAVNRTADTETEDEDLSLWPRRLGPGEGDAIFRSPRMAELLRIAERLAAANLPILLCGETGTGKEVVARLIHEASAVKRGPFVPFNCSALPRELVESQLFGHRRGAFTGATDTFPGIIRAAERGTLFLDEIGDLDLATQPKLLRFLESGEIHPVGDARAQRVNVRVVAAANVDLESLVADGRFRRDLFYRIGVARISLPPLRERKDEIPAMASLFLTRCMRECGRSGLRLGDDLIAALLLYDWPGNIRQLANEIRRVTAMADDGQTLGVGDLDAQIIRNWQARPHATPASSPPSVQIRLDQPLAQGMADLERKFIEHALGTADGRVAEAAHLLGLSRKGLFLKRRRQGLVTPPARASQSFEPGS